jgi:putative selenate reductase
MPAEYNEIKDVLDEGIEIIELVSPLEVISKSGSVSALKCIKMKLGEKDASGRARPVEIEGSEFEIPCDTIIPAIGQSLAIDFIDKTKLQTEKNSYETKLPNVFIGGDALRGASTLINGVGDGRKAAQEIINRVQIEFDTLKIETDRKFLPLNELMLKKTIRIEGVKVKETNINNRKNFNLVTSVLSKEEAIEEASRCLLCDEVCNICTSLCPNLALQSYDTESVKYDLQKITMGIIEPDSVFEISQNQQIIHIADWCNQCGNCETFCPSSGAPYKEKPRLYLNKTYFTTNDDGYYYENENHTLSGKEGNINFSLTETIDFYIYQTENLIAKLDKKTLKIIEFSGAGNKSFNFKKAAEMSIILNGAKKM